MSEFYRSPEERTSDLDANAHWQLEEIERPQGRDLIVETVSDDDGRSFTISSELCKLLEAGAEEVHVVARGRRHLGRSYVQEGSRFVLTRKDGLIHWDPALPQGCGAYEEFYAESEVPRVCLVGLREDESWPAPRAAAPTTGGSEGPQSKAGAPSEWDHPEHFRERPRVAEFPLGFATTVDELHARYPDGVDPGLGDRGENYLPEDLEDILAAAGYRVARSLHSIYFEIFFGSESAFIGTERQVRHWMTVDEPTGGRRRA